MLRNYVKSFLKPALTNSFKASRNYTPRRALLYVPANDMKKILKAFELDVDCITLDCEDGVSLSKKAEARGIIRDVLNKGKPVKTRKYDLCVRVNSISSGIVKEDLSVILAAKQTPDTFFLPKVESSDDLRLFSGYIAGFLKTESNLGLIIGIESAMSLVNIVDICKTAKELFKTSHLTPEALLFGGDDFCASIGARKSESLSEIMYARQKVVTVAKAFQLQAIDVVYIKYKDLEGLKKQAEGAAQMGYSGKQVIHPGQVEITQSAFMPTQKEVEWAEGVLKAFEAHEKEGKGVFVYKDQMIDMPTVKQAMNIMELVKLVVLKK